MRQDIENVTLRCPLLSVVPMIQKTAPLHNGTVFIQPVILVVVYCKSPVTSKSTSQSTTEMPGTFFTKITLDFIFRCPSLIVL